MADPIFGISIRKVDEGARPVLAADLSTIGIIGPAPLADPTLFPYDTPVFVNSNDTTKTRKLGEMGYLSDAIRGINDQLGETQFAARIVIVRTPEGTDVDPAIKLQQTISKIAGDSLNGTGMWAFLKSPQKLGFTPRILTAPGYTSQMANGVGLIERTTPGSSYVQDHSYPVTFSGGGPDAVQATGHAYGLSNGQLGPIELELPGAWYDTPPTIEALPAGFEAGTAVISAGGIGYGVGEQLILPHQVILLVATVGAGGEILTTTISTKGFIIGTDEPPDTPQEVISSSGTGTGASFTVTWTEIGELAEYTCCDRGWSQSDCCRRNVGLQSVARAHDRGIGRVFIPKRHRLARDHAEPSADRIVWRLPGDGPGDIIHRDPSACATDGRHHGAT